MQRHASMEWKWNASLKKQEWKKKSERRKGLILYLILFSTYLLILMLWKDMDK